MAAADMSLSNDNDQQLIFDLREKYCDVFPVMVDCPIGNQCFT